MKNLLSLLLLCSILGLISSCHKDFDTDNEIISKSNIYDVNVSGRQIKADAVFHSEILTSNPMKAGEVFPNANAPAKGRLEIDLADRFQKEFAKDYPGLTKDKLINMQIHWISVTVNGTRCKLLREYRVNQVTLPDGSKLLQAPVIVRNTEADYCENYKVNNMLYNNIKDLYGKDIAPAIKANGKLVFDYSLTADKDLIGKATGFTVEVKTSLAYQAN